MSALHQARHLRALVEQADKPPAGGGGEGPAGRALDLVSIGLQLARSVAVLDDDEARAMRESAHRAGANPQLLAAALRLRDKRQAEDVTVVGDVCLCSHPDVQHDEVGCVIFVCGCREMRPKGRAK